MRRCLNDLKCVELTPVPKVALDFFILGAKIPEIIQGS